MTTRSWRNPALRPGKSHRAGTSPMMRVQFPAWRFNVEIPPGTKRISLVTMDACDGTREDFADWVNAGFIVGK